LFSFFKLRDSSKNVLVVKTNVILKGLEKTKQFESGWKVETENRLEIKRFQAYMGSSDNIEHERSQHVIIDPVTVSAFFVVKDEYDESGACKIFLFTSLSTQ